jgi:hypothetical protein
MRYRPLSPTGDYTIGVPFLTGSAAVAQAIETRLKLFLGEWFIDVTDGTPWLPTGSPNTGILGRQFGADPNAPIRLRILGTPGVTQILTYSSTITGRSISVSGTVSTQFSTDPTPFAVTINPPALSAA